MFNFSYKQGLFLISLLIIISLSLSVVSGVEDSTLNNISNDSDSIRVVSTDIENSQDIEVSNLEVSDNDKNTQEISNVSADNTFATIQQQINSASAGSTIRLSGTYVGSGSQIILNKTLTIDGQGATLNGKNLSRIFNVTSSNCIIKNIHFINGYDSNHQISTSGIIDWSGANGCLINCTFTGAYVTAHGGSVYWRGSKGTINNCTFINSHSTVQGGSVYWEGANGVVNNSNFIGSYGTSGGSIAWTGVNGTLSNSNFINSSVSNYGGSVYWSSAYGKIYNCSFNNSVGNTFSGGAVYCAGVNCSIENSTFFNCSVKSDDDGGAVYVVAANFTINNCNFTSNRATRNGGGIAVSNQAFNARVENCIFDKCTASSGGAIYLDNITSGTSAYKIISSTFKNCSASYAGAIYIIGDSNLIDYCNFLDCKATDSGGAISFACGNSVLNNSYFNNCHAVFAGAVYVSGDSNLIDCADFYNCNCIVQKTLVVSGSVSWAGNNGKLINSNFVNSTASCMLSSGGVEEITNAYGGSVSWYGSNGLIDGCNFINSTSNDTYNTYGGAIYWVGNNGKVIYSTFINSLSSAFVNGNGGAIYWDSANGEIVLCTFTNSSSIHSYSKGSSGGCAVYLNGINSDALLTNCTFENSHANNVSVIYSESTKEIYNSSFIMKSDDVAKDMVDGVSLDTLINQENKFVTKSIINTSDFSSKYGSKVNLTTNVKNEYGGNINEGSVTFYKNGTIIGTANVVNGKAIYTYICDDVGIFDFKAVYTGSNNYGPSTATSQLYIENAILETTTSVNNTSSSYNKTVNLSTSVKTEEGIIVNGGTVTFYIGNDVIGTADVVNGVATYSYKCNLTGTISIKAVYSGFNNFNPSNTTFTLNVAKLNTTVVVNPVNADYGKSVDLSATVNAGNVNIDGGIVSFYVNNKYIGNGILHDGVASCSYTPNIVGTFTYRAEYQGSDYYNPSNNSSNLHIDNVATKVIVDPVYTNYGASANLSATVKTKDNILINTGTVSFYVNDSYVGEGTVNSDGVAICSYYCNVTGDFVIKAVYNGPIGFDGSNNTSTLSVSSKGTITVLDFGPADYGDVVELVATVSASDAIVNDGTVTFYINNDYVTVDVIDGVARYNYTCSEMGTFNIKAVYSGSSLFDMSISLTKQLIIGKIATSTNIILGTAYYGDVVELVATVSSSDAIVNDGTVKFYINGQDTLVYIPVVDGMARYNYTCDKLGTFPIRAVFTGSDNFDESEYTSTLVVSNSIATVVVDNITVSYGEKVTLKATIKTNNTLTVNNGTVKFYVNDEYKGKKILTNGVATCSYTCNNGGNFIIKVEYAGTTGVSASIGEGNLNVSGIATITTLNPISASYNDTIDLNATVKTIDGNIINGGIVNFYVNDVCVGNGTVNSDGVATYSYNCSAIGNFIIRADYEGIDAYASSTNTSTLNVSKLSTSITMESYVSSNNTITLNVNIHSTLTVNEGTVTFYMNDTQIGTPVNVKDGVATLIYDCEEVGIFTIRAVYSGSNIFNSSTSTSPLNVDGLKTIIIIDSVDTSYNDTVNLTAIVKTPEGDAVTEGNVTFYIGNLEIKNVPVNDKGISICSYNCSSIGNFTINVVYTGSVRYNSSFNSANLNVNPLNTYVSVNDIDTNYGSDVTLSATVKTIDNIPINEGVVVFYIGGEEIGRNTTSDGVATYKHIFNNVGNFTVLAIYEGPNYFRSSNSNFRLKVNKVNTSIVVNDRYVDYGEKLNIDIPINSINGTTVNAGIVSFYVNDGYVGNDTVDSGFVTFTYDCVNVGNFNVKVVYEGSTSFNPSNNNFVLRVDPIDTNVIINNVIASYNDVITLNATVKSADGSNILGGIVSFYVNGSDVGDGTVVDGVAHCNYTCTNVGNFIIAVSYNGYDSYGPSNSTSSLKVNSANTIVSVDSDFASYNDTVELIANVMTSDNVPVNEGIVSFYVDDVSVGNVTVVDGVAHCNYACTKLGNLAVRVEYKGTTNYTSSLDFATLNVSKLGTVIVVDSVSASYNDTVELSANVMISDNVPVNGGIVSFYVDDVCVGNGTVVDGVASYNYNCDKVGDFTITARFTDLYGFEESGNTSTLNVSGLATVIVVDSVSASYNDTVTLRATVKSINNENINNGAVTFYIDGTKVKTVNINNGVVTCSYTCNKVGDFTIEAVYDGSDVYASSTNVSTLRVSGLATFTVLDSVSASYNDTVTLRATVKSINNVLVNEGLVSFYVDGVLVGNSSVSNGVAIYNYKCNVAGNFTILANYSGCEYYAPSTYTSKLEVNSLNVILTPGTVFSSNFTANLVVNIKTEDGNLINEGNVTFYVDGTKVGTAKVSGGVATYKYHYDNLGEYEVKYVYSGSNNYNNNSSISTFKTSSLVTSISCNPIYTISGDVVTLTAYVSAEGNKTVNGGTVIFSTEDEGDIEPCIVSNGVAFSNHIFNSYGVYNLTVRYYGLEGYFDQASTLTTLTVGYLPTITTISSAPSTYGSTVTLTAKVTAESLVNDGQVTFYVAGTKIGSSSVNSNGVATYSYSCKKAGTLTIKAEYGNSKLFSASTGSSSLVVAKAQATMTVTVPSTCYYKGTKITIKLVDTKTKKVLANEKIVITIGTTKTTVTTNANGVATYNVALVPKSYNSKFVLSSNNYNSNSPTKVIKIVKATSVTLAPTVLSTTYNSKKAFQVKVYKGSVLFVGAKVKLKVYTGKKYKTVTITTGTNGIAQYKDASVLSVEKHKVTISCAESTSYMTATAKTSYITVKKAPTTVSAPKVTNKYKKSAYFKVTVKMKSTGYTVPAGVAIKLKVYTGSKYKTYTVKTNSKGVASFNTQSLTVGTHKVVISSGHIYYTISATSSIVIKK